MEAIHQIYKHIQPNPIHPTYYDCCTMWEFQYKYYIWIMQMINTNITNTLYMNICMNTWSSIWNTIYVLLHMISYIDLKCTLHNHISCKKTIYEIWGIITLHQYRCFMLHNMFIHSATIVFILVLIYSTVVAFMCNIHSTMQWIYSC